MHLVFKIWTSRSLSRTFLSRWTLTCLKDLKGANLRLYELTIHVGKVKITRGGIFRWQFLAIAYYRACPICVLIAVSTSTSYTYNITKSIRISSSSPFSKEHKSRSTVDESMYLITVLTSFLQASRLNPRPLQVSRLWFVGILWLYRSLKA